MDNNNNVEVREMLDRLIIYKHSATMVTTKNASFQDDRRDIKSLYSRYQYIHKGEKKKKKKKKKKRNHRQHFCNTVIIVTIIWNHKCISVHNWVSINYHTMQHG